jgi:DNA-binding NtrC family response regulator
MKRAIRASYDMGKKILVVEDDEAWRRMAAAALQEAGFEVVGVSGAREAVLQKELTDLSLIVLDLDLGGENGLMLMKHLKRYHPNVPIMIYTGMEPDEAAVQRMREQGAELFLRKGPVSELVGTVKQRVNRG